MLNGCQQLQVTSIGDEASVGPSAITSISLTPDGEYLLANLRSHTGHLWRVGPIARRIAKPVLEGSGEGPYGLAPEGRHCGIREMNFVKRH